MSNIVPFRRPDPEDETEDEENIIVLPDLIDPDDSPA